MPLSEKSSWFSAWCVASWDICAPIYSWSSTCLNCTFVMKNVFVPLCYLHFLSPICHKVHVHSCLILQNAVWSLGETNIMDRLHTWQGGIDGIAHAERFSPVLLLNIFKIRGFQWFKSLATPKRMWLWSERDEQSSGNGIFHFSTSPNLAQTRSSAALRAAMFNYSMTDM